jgi:hypothetical protein
MIHDNHTPRILEYLSNLLLLLRFVRARVPDRLNMRSERRRRAAFGVFNRDALFCGCAENVHGVEVDGGIRLRCRFRKGRSCGEDMVRVEVLVLSYFLDRCFNAAQGGRGNDGELIFIALGELL